MESSRLSFSLGSNLEIRDFVPTYTLAPPPPPSAPPWPNRNLDNPNSSLPMQSIEPRQSCKSTLPPPYFMAFLETISGSYFRCTGWLRQTLGVRWRRQLRALPMRRTSRRALLTRLQRSTWSTSTPACAPRRLRTPWFPPSPAPHPMLFRPSSRQAFVDPRDFV